MSHIWMSHVTPEKLRIRDVDVWECLTPNHLLLMWQTIEFVTFGNDLLTFVTFKSCHREWGKAHLIISDCTLMLESCHMWLCHGTHVTVSWHMCGSESCHMYGSESCHREWGKAHLMISDCTHMHESCHVWLCHGTLRKEWCLTYEWVMSHLRSWGREE